MLIREITQDDVETIAHMRVLMLDEVTDEPLPWQLEGSVRRFVWKHMQDNTCLGVVAEDEGKVIADAVIYLFETMPDEVNVRGLTAMLYNVYTLPEYRGRGIGTAVLRRCLAQGKPVYLYVFTGNVRAVALYEREGFRKVEDVSPTRCIMAR